MNGGAGVTANDFKITDSAGNVGAVDLNPTGNVATTLGDVIDRINALTIGVEARINDAGDGLLLTDTAAGAGNLKVEEVGNTTTAKDLRILGTAVGQEIDGTELVTVTIGEDDTLADLVETINGLGRGGWRASQRRHGPAAFAVGRQVRPATAVLVDASDRRRSTKSAQPRC
jgi:flagellar hook-associated protein 2